MGLEVSSKPVMYLPAFALKGFLAMMLSNMDVIWLLIGHAYQFSG